MLKSIFLLGRPTSTTPVQVRPSSIKPTAVSLKPETSKPKLPFLFWNGFVQCPRLSEIPPEHTKSSTKTERPFLTTQPKRPVTVVTPVPTS